MSAPARVRGPWWLLAGGLVLLVTSAVAMLLLAASQLDGYDWAEEAMVEDDGRPHVVRVDRDRNVLLWSYAADAEPSCTVRDAATAEVLPSSRPDDALVREGGSAADWEATAVFTPRSDQVEVVCDPTGAQPFSLVAVESAPRLPPLLSRLGPWSVVPLSVAAAGVASVLAAGVVALRTRRRAGHRAVET
ncbi:hypothetical protein [Nocardioides ferulae]|uniref:hypothetical protein n=1 Tax=Nocardioides ferulae TaxID=2340821 RepID=UPI000EB4E73C|nr:hypothetical protein [Nocardioides ferulae]